MMWATSRELCRFYPIVVSTAERVFDQGTTTREAVDVMISTQGTDGGLPKLFTWSIRLIKLITHEVPGHVVAHGDDLALIIDVFTTFHTNFTYISPHHPTPHSFNKHPNIPP